MGHTSFPLLVHRLAKPRADSLVSYAFRLIWICVVVFQLRMYYYLFTQSFRNESHPIFWCVSFHEVFAFLRCLNRPFCIRWSRDQLCQNTKTVRFWISRKFENFEIYEDSYGKPFGRDQVAKVLIQILLIFRGRCNSYFEIYGWKFTGYLIWALANKFSLKANYFRVYRITEYEEFRNFSFIIIIIIINFI